MTTRLVSFNLGGSLGQDSVDRIMDVGRGLGLQGAAITDWAAALLMKAVEAEARKMVKR